MSEQRRIAAACALLLGTTAAIAWLPRLAVPNVASYLALAAGAAAAFLALVGFADRNARRGAPLRNSPFSPRRLLWGALLLRIAVVAAPPWLSDDLWRYLWEGQVQRAGFSPYVHAPDDPALSELRDDLHSRVAFGSIPAVYPPAAQLLFRATPPSPYLWKALIAAIDLAFVAWMVHRLGRGSAHRALLYAWNPLVLLEGAASGHVDALAWMATVVALDRFASQRTASAARAVATGALAGIAGMLKPQGFVALLGLLRAPRLATLLGAVVAIALPWLPFASDGLRLFDGLARYAHDWEMNGLCYPPCVRLAEHVKAWLEALPDTFSLWRVREIGYEIVPNQLGRKLSTLLFLGVVALLLRRWRGRVLPLAFFVIAAFLATTPAVHPWYVAWLAAFLPFLPNGAGRFALALTVTTLAAHAIPVARLADGAWSEPPWIALTTWLAPCALFAWSSWRGEFAPLEAADRTIGRS
ncbi:MAG: hypothetical protein EXR73_00935 [Myxococcales bacterium]|nr:hypothetical protein [Myxococcales bacterium]